MNALGPDDLVLHAGTCQNRSFRELCETARAGGFQAITIYPAHYRGAHADGLSDADIRQVLSDHGLVVADLDAVLDWIPGEEVPPAFEGGEKLLYEIHDALGGTSLNLAYMGGPLQTNRAADGMAEVCERAAQRDLVVTLEYLPWSGIPDAATAWEIVQRTACQNATLMFDAWHTFRGSSDEAQLRAVPGERWGSIQLDDAPAQAQDDLVAETLSARLLPGEGDAPVADWLRILRDNGCRVPVGVEVFSAELDRLSPAEAGRRLGEATRNVIAAAA